MSFDIELKNNFFFRNIRSLHGQINKTKKSCHYFANKKAG